MKTCSCLVHSFLLHGGILKLFGIKNHDKMICRMQESLSLAYMLIIVMARSCLLCKNHVTGLKIRVRLFKSNDVFSLGFVKISKMNI